MMNGTRKKGWDIPARLGIVSWMLALLLILPVPGSADSYVGGMPLDPAEIGIVSGDLFVDATMPSWGQMDVTKQFSIPAYSQIRWARLYVVVYCGHMQNNYNGTAMVSFDGDGDGNYETVLGTETLDVPYTYVINGGPGYVVLNSHLNRVTSDYLMWYDVGPKIISRNPGARVETAGIIPGSSFDGRIKAITLVVAYDDGDSDQVWYSVNQGQDTDTYYSDEQLGEDYRGETSFDPSGLSESVEKATLTVNHLSSQDGFYRFNGEDLDGGQNQGTYFGYDTWDVTDEVKSDDSNLLTYDRYGDMGSELSGQFYKIILATLTIRQGSEPEDIPEEDEEPPEEAEEPAPTSASSSGDTTVKERSDITGGNGYNGQTIPAAITGMVNGSVNIYETSDYSGLILAGEAKNYSLQVPINPEDDVRLARLYVYTTWDHDEKRREGCAAPLALQYGGKTLSPAAQYSDRKGFGIYDYPAETFAYDIRDLLKETGNYSFSVRNTGKKDEAFAVYGLLLVLASETSGGIPTLYWIAEGSDILLASPEFQTTTEDSTTLFTFEEVPSGASAAKLSLISTAGSGIKDDENRITFNDAEWANLLVNGPSATSIATVDVLENLHPGTNEATIQSYFTLKRGDYLENRGAVLVVVQGNTIPVPGSARPIGQIPVRVTSTIKAAETQVSVTPPAGQSTEGALDWLLRFIFAPIFPSSASPAGSGSTVSPSEVTLTVITDPEGATVTVNGIDYEELTPLAVPVSRDETQEVTVTLDGYDPYQATLIPTADHDLHIIFTPYVPPKAAESSSSFSGNGKLGGVYIESYPSEATILIDGKKTEQVTPKVVYGLREGYHTVAVEKKNFAFPGKKRVYVSAGTITQVSFDEGGAFARTLNITSADYPDTSFTVNGRGPSVEMPGEAEVEGLPAYIVILHDGSYISRNVLPQLESGDTMVVREERTDAESLTVIISSEPTGSEIFFDGFPTGLRTPAAVTNVSPGLHRVTVQAPGFLPYEHELTVSDVMNNPIDSKVEIRLESYPYGSLNLTSSPSGAKVYLSGRNTGEKTPVTIPYLPIGMYTIRLKGEDESRNYDVVVTPGEEKSLHAVFPV